VIRIACILRLGFCHKLPVIVRSKPCTQAEDPLPARLPISGGQSCSRQRKRGRRGQRGGRKAAVWQKWTDPLRRDRARQHRRGRKISWMLNRKVRLYLRSCSLDELRALSKEYGLSSQIEAQGQPRAAYEEALQSRLVTARKVARMDLPGRSRSRSRCRICRMRANGSRRMWRTLDMTSCDRILLAKRRFYCGSSLSLSSAGQCLLELSTSVCYRP
jgi:hypothetical protein